MGRPPRIDRGAVLAAGLTLADAGGLDALTMAKVAERLGVTPMALYRHVADKADLLDGLVELLLTEFPAPSEAGAWDERLAALARNIRSSARRHPSVFPLLLQRPATTDEARRTRDAVHAALRDAGVRVEQVAQVERLVSTAILGFSVSEVAGRFAHLSTEERDADFDALLAALRGFIAARADR